LKDGNIVLIGMPSSGKSTVGQYIAKTANMGFIDTDTVIKNRENMALRDIVEVKGLKYFLNIQEGAILELEVDNSIISTGGSVVYSKKAMEHLNKNSVVIFLETPFQDIEERIVSGRRFARNADQTLKDVYQERLPLYREYADITINCSGRAIEDIADEIRGRIGR